MNSLHVLSYSFLFLLILSHLEKIIVKLSIFLRIFSGIYCIKLTLSFVPILKLCEPTIHPILKIQSQQITCWLHEPHLHYSRSDCASFANVLEHHQQSLYDTLKGINQKKGVLITIQKKSCLVGEYHVRQGGLIYHFYPNSHKRSAHPRMLRLIILIIWILINQFPTAWLSSDTHQKLSFIFILNSIV